MRTISPGPSSYSSRYPSLWYANDSNEMQCPASLLPMSTGRRPMLSRAAMILPSLVMMSSVSDPSMAFWACLMPETKSSFWLMSAATSSVVFTLPELIAMNWRPPLAKFCSTSSSALLMAPTVVTANVPRCERTSKGCGSVSLMQPMPLPPWKPGRSSSKRVRNGVFSMEWISRWNPSSAS